MPAQGFPDDVCGRGSLEEKIKAEAISAMRWRQYQGREDLAVDWDAAVAPAVTRELGTRWLQSRGSLALQVPSALSPATNLLINPQHPDAGQVTVGQPVPVSPRVLRL
jgi:RES domain-containing protein